MARLICVPPAVLPTDDAALVARVRAGDERAFRTIFSAYYDSLCHFAASRIRSREEAEELVQDTFLAIWAQYPVWTVSESLRSYLYGAVRNRIVNAAHRHQLEHRWRDRIASVGRTLAWRAPAPDAVLDANELAAAVQAVLDTLPPRCREAFCLSREHGLTTSEIAGVMGTTPKTVEIQVGKALGRLRARLADRALPNG